MKSSKLWAVIIATTAVVSTAAASPGGIDMKDPRRAVGLEDDIRIDAQVMQEAVGASSPVTVRYQIHNLTRATIAVADRVAESSYDPDSQTITLSLGCEVPSGGLVPHLVLIASGQTKTLTGGAVVHVAVPGNQSRFTPRPRLVQVTVNVLRDVSAFEGLIEQPPSKTPAVMADGLFEKWIESNEPILLNAVPVHWNAGAGRSVGADQRAPSPAGSF